MGWRLIEVDPATDEDLTDAELIGIWIYLADEERTYGRFVRADGRDISVYINARDKIQPQVQIAIRHREGEE